MKTETVTNKTTHTVCRQWSNACHQLDSPRRRGIPFDSCETPQCIDVALAAVEVGIFLPQLANWTTAASTWFVSLEGASTSKQQEKRLITQPSPVVSGKMGARPETSISTHWVTDFTCFGKPTSLNTPDACNARNFKAASTRVMCNVHSDGASRRTSSCAARRFRQLGKARNFSRQPIPCPAPSSTCFA